MNSPQHFYSHKDSSVVLRLLRFDVMWVFWSNLKDMCLYLWEDTCNQGVRFPWAIQKGCSTGGEIPVSVWIEVSKATSAAMDENECSVDAAPATCDDTVIEQRADGAGATEAARKLEWSLMRKPPEMLPCQWRRLEAPTSLVHLFEMRPSGVSSTDPEFPECPRVLTRNKTYTPFPNKKKANNNCPDDEGS